MSGVDAIARLLRHSLAIDEYSVSFRAHATQGGALQAELDRLVMQHATLQATTSQAKITLPKMKHSISHRRLLRDTRVVQVVGE